MYRQVHGKEAAKQWDEAVGAKVMWHIYEVVLLVGCDHGRDVCVRFPQSASSLALTHKFLSRCQIELSHSQVSILRFAPTKAKWRGSSRNDHSLFSHGTNSYSLLLILWGTRLRHC